MGEQKRQFATVQFVVLGRHWLVLLRVKLAMQEEQLERLRQVLQPYGQGAQDCS